MASTYTLTLREHPISGTFDARFTRVIDGKEMAHGTGDSIARAVMRAGVQLEAQPEVRQGVRDR